MKKQHQLIYGSMLLVTLVYLAFFCDFKTFQIYPIDDITKYDIGTYREEMDSGWSAASYTFDDKKIVFSYELSSGRHDPFAAVTFRDKCADSNLVNLKGFNSFSIYLDAEYAQKIPVSLRFRNDSIIKLSKKYPELPLLKVIDYTSKGVYEIKLDEFQIATWWLRHHGIEKDKINVKEFTALKYVTVGSCKALEPGSKDTIIIGDIMLFNDHSTMYIVVFSAFFFVFMLFYRLNKRAASKKTVVVERIEIRDKSDDLHKQVAVIKNYIGQNYSDSNLTMIDIQKELKINAVKVREVFKEGIKDSFKGYLMKVRIIEVKRLLLIDSNLTISEIACKCGFKDIPNFNRQFKKETGFSPKSFKSKG
jgi:YesN/AraC family two-component response regulator